MDKIRILVADDHPLFRKGLKRFLASVRNFDCVAVAENGEEAVKLAQELRPDVAIIDIEMPKVMGIEAARQIKEFCPDTAVLVLSAYKYDYYLIACLEAGVNGYLLKTAPPGELTDAIHMVHAGKSVFESNATNVIARRIANRTGKESDGSGELHSRELQVLKLVAIGKTNKEISQELSISEHTVGAHLVNIFGKLRVGSRTEAALVALQRGYFTITDIIPSKM